MEAWSGGLDSWGVAFSADIPASQGESLLKLMSIKSVMPSNHLTSRTSSDWLLPLGKPSSEDSLLGKNRGKEEKHCPVTCSSLQPPQELAGP